MKNYYQRENDVFRGLKQLKPISPNLLESRIHAMCELFDLDTDIPVFFVQEKRKVLGIWDRTAREMIFYGTENVEWKTAIHEVAHAVHQLSPAFNATYITDSKHGEIHTKIMHLLASKLMIEESCKGCGLVYNTTFDYTVSPLRIHNHACPKHNAKSN